MEVGNRQIRVGIVCSSVSQSRSLFADVLRTTSFLSRCVEVHSVPVHHIAVGLLVLVTIFGSTVEAGTLIGRWDFEEGSGSTAFNSSPISNLNGTISNAIYTTDAARGSYALDFNGSNSFVEVLNNPLLVPDTIGISLWFKGRSTQVLHADLIDKGHGSGSTPYYAGYVFQYNAAGNAIETIYGNGSAFIQPNTGSLNPKDNQWHHLVANLGQSEVSVYVDGSLVSTSAGSGPLVQNDSNLYFGRHRALGRYFNGLLDDIQLYDGALSQSQVTALYQNTSVVPEPSTCVVWGLFALAGVSCRRRRTRAV